MIVDLENHLFLEEQTDRVSSKSRRVCERRWDENGKLKNHVFREASSVDRYLQFMDEAGIDMAVLTTNAMGGLDQMRRWNDFCAKVVKENPKRFVGFASIPPIGGKPAFDELTRAVNELGLKGVHIFTQIDGHPLDSMKLWPFYERVSELKIPVDVHIATVPTGFDALYAPYALHYVMAREFDICATTLRICLGGVLEEFPDLVFIVNHFGGGVSSVMERIDVCWPDFYRGKPLITKPWKEYFNKLYFNMAGREVGMAAVKSALTNISPRKLMFGTDWPFNFDYDPQGVRRYVEEIRKLDLPQDDIDGMLGSNAVKLLGI